MFNLKKSIINWEAYDRLGLTDYKEFFILDIVRLLQRTEGSRHPGWCYMSRENMASQLRISKRTVQRFIKPLIEKGYLETNSLGHLKCAADVYNLLKFGTAEAGRFLEESKPEKEGGDTLARGVTDTFLGVTDLSGGVTDLSKGGDNQSPNTSNYTSKDTREREAHTHEDQIEATKGKNNPLESSAALHTIHPKYLPIYEGLKKQGMGPLELKRAAEILVNPSYLLDFAFDQLNGVREKQSEMLAHFLCNPNFKTLSAADSRSQIRNTTRAWVRNANNNKLTA